MAWHDPIDAIDLIGRRTDDQTSVSANAWIELMKALLAICLCMAAAGPRTGRACSSSSALRVRPSTQAQFDQWADQWQAAAEKAAAESIRIGPTDGSRRHRPRAITLDPGREVGHGQPREPLWIVLIGHGTYDGREAKFNLRGPDVTDLELAEWLAPLKRPVVILDCTSASGPFINRLSGENRVVVTATKSGYEMNFARFGQYLAEAIADQRADLDKDGQVSLLEAFLTASSRVDEYYRTHSQLATEHALLDDNGDRLGTPANWFRGVRATKRAKDGARSTDSGLTSSTSSPAIASATCRRRCASGAISSNCPSPPCGIRRTSSGRMSTTSGSRS